jgi:TonB family protein
VVCRRSENITAEDAEECWVDRKAQNELVRKLPIALAALAFTGSLLAQSVDPPPINDVLRQVAPDPHALDFLQTGLHIAKPMVDSWPIQVGPVQQVYRKIGNGVKAPQLTHSPQPEYTPEARQKHLQGDVTLQLIIDKTGSPREIRVVRRTLGSGLEEKAVEAVRQWRFEPATKNGEPVIFEMTVEVHFRLYN